MAPSQAYSRLFTVHEANVLLPALSALIERVFRGGVRMETLAIVMGLAVLIIFGYAVWVVTH